MPLQDTLMQSIKEAMKAKDSLRLDALRAIKSAILLATTQAGSKDSLTEDQEIQLLQKLVKQRRDSAAIFKEQNRLDLAAPEEAQAAVISEFLPQQLSPSEVEAIVTEVINASGAQGMKDMGKVMGIASKKMTGVADGKTISGVVKKLLS